MIFSINYMNGIVVVAFDHNHNNLGYGTVSDELDGWRWAKSKGAAYYSLRYRTGRDIGKWSIDTNPVTGRIVSSA